jgi:hypothetical protein
LSIFLVPIPELQHAPLPLKVLRAREHAPTPSPFDVFTFGLIVKSIKELMGASHGIRALVELDPLIEKFRWH